MKTEKQQFNKRRVWKDKMADGDPNLVLPLGDSDFEKVCKDLLRSGEISSDG